MLSFKEYLIENNGKPENTGLSWEGQSFGEHDKTKLQPVEDETPSDNTGVSFEGQSFGEHKPGERNPTTSLGEATTSSKPFSRKVSGTLGDVLKQQISNIGENSTNKNGDEYDRVHDLPGMKPKSQNSAVRNYTGTPSNDAEGHESSANMNGLARNLFGDKSCGVLHHTPQKVYDGLQRFLSNFSRNAITKECYSYTGVPPHIGKQLQTGKMTHFAGITSSSTSPKVALNFAKGYHNYDESKTMDIVQIHHPEGGTGNAMSVAKNSLYGHEHEITIHPGSEFEHLGTTEISRKDLQGRTRKYRIHHIRLKSSRRPLPPLSEYTAPVPKVPKQDALTQALTGKIGKK